MDVPADDDETADYRLASAWDKFVFCTFWFLLATVMWLIVVEIILQWGRHMGAYDGWVVTYTVGMFYIAFIFGLVFAFFHNKYALHLSIVGVVIVEAVLLWGVVTAPDNTSRAYLMVAMVIPIAGYLVLKFVYDRFWREYEMPFIMYSELDRS